MESVAYFLYYYAATALRYFLIAGSAFLLFYVFYTSKLARWRIQQWFPQKQDYYREVFYSLLTFVIFSLIGVLITQPTVLPHTKIYFQVSAYGWGYFGLSIVLALLLHDTYF